MRVLAKFAVDVEIKPISKKGKNVDTVGGMNAMFVWARVVFEGANDNLSIIGASSQNIPIDDMEIRDICPSGCATCSTTERFSSYVTVGYMWYNLSPGTFV